tara:strand:- start:4060 stop:4302 length:243 start_codon:yes stop_codon:yes gene_type:complete
MINKQQKEKQMRQTKTKVKNKSSSFFQVLGGLLVVFAIADFAVSWMGINLTPFMGGASRFSPLIFGFVGAALMNIGNEDG